MKLFLLVAIMATVPKHEDKIPITEWPDRYCLSVTNYWPFDESGQLAAYGGQADSDPYHTAVMHPITSPEQAYTFVAGPLPLIGRSVTLPGIGTLPVLDTFGIDPWQSGAFYHDGYGRMVVGIDVFAPEPIYYLECEWGIE